MPRSISRMAFLCGLLVLTAAQEGCQREPTWNLVPVEGTITKDGRPLRGVEVVFLPDADAQGPRSSGITDETGHYRLRADGGGEGAAVCAHRVCLHDTQRISPMFRNRVPKEKVEQFKKEAAASPRVPPRYGRFNETPLRTEVRPGEQVIDLEVK